jgi:type VI protein secretion system component VasF
MENMPSPAKAERNQRRKLAFIPMWPIVGAVVVVVALVLWGH